MQDPAGPDRTPWDVPPEPEPRRPKRFGPLQGLMLVVGFMVMQTLVVVGTGFLRGFAIALMQSIRASMAGASRPPFPPTVPGPTFVAASVIVGYVLAALWCRHYALRRAGERLHLGTPEGFAWCPASRDAYPVAAVLAALTVAAAAAILCLLPVAPGRVPHSEFQALLTPDWMLGPSLTLLFVVAPLTEEFIFRGAAFAAFARRTGPAGATTIVTLLFVAVHAPEKIHYPPGFIDVSLMALAAAWLRLRYRSIRPAIFLHILYNLGVSGAAVLLH